MQTAEIDVVEVFLVLMGTYEDESRTPLAAASLKDGSACRYVTLYLRLALGTAFLSAVADRFGLWGPAGAPHVAWGNFHNFLTYTGRLNPWFPASWIPTVGWLATFCEIIIGIALVLGVYTRIAALLSGLLTLAFALGMTSGLTIKAPLDASVFTASAASLLLACNKVFPISLDSLTAKYRKRT